MLTRHEIISKFLSDMAEQGMECHEDIIDDGHFHAFSTNGDKGGKRSGRYFLRMDGVPAGYYGCWRRNEWYTWSAKKENQMSPEERQAFRQSIAQAKARRESERQEKHKDARAEARNIWNTAVPASNQHPYLKAKGLPTANLKSYDGKLVVPLVDAQGTIHSLQYIHANGFKQFLEGGTVTGHYHVIGNPQPRGTIYIAEGVATAITVHLATKQGVIVAFNAGNLTAVARAIRDKYLDAGIVIAGDDDQFNEVNAGRKHANEAARAVNGKVSFPRFGDLSKKPTDWDDLRMQEGLEVVTKQLAGNAVEPEIEPEPFNGFFTMDEMRADRWLEKDPPKREWILREIMPVGKTGMIVAPGGTGKSQLLMQLAISIATGVPLFGKYEVENTGGVMAFFAEDDDEELHRRFRNSIRDILEAPGISLDRERFMVDLQKNLFISSMVGQDVRITMSGPDGPMLTANFKRFLATAKQIPDLRMIMLDPIIRFLSGDQNDASESTRLVQAGERLSQETGAFVLWANHANKASMRMGGDAMGQEASRGSSALTDGMRWQMNLATMDKKSAKSYGIQEKERGYYVQMSVPKNNYAAPFSPGWLKRGAGGYLSYVELEDQDEIEIEHILEKAVQIIKERAEAGTEYTKRQFCERFSGKAGELKCGNNRLRAMLEIAIERGLIVEKPPREHRRNVTTVLAIPDE